MKIIKRILISLVIVALLFILVSLLATYYLTHQNNLVFQAGSCSTGTADPWEPETLGIKETIWKDGSLNIKAFVSVNCADHIIAGRYLLSDGAVNLTYYLDNPKTIKAECMCAKEINYQISSISKAEYSVELQEKSNIFLTLGFNILSLFGI